MRDLILLHGALETSKVMAPLQKILSESFRCHTLSLAGHGAPGAWPDPFRIETFVEQLDEYLVQQQLKSVTVVGHSMGGFIALSHLAFVESSPISRVVCYGTKFDWSEKTVAGMLAQLHPENEALMAFLKQEFGDQANRLLASTTHMMSHLERLDGLHPNDLSEIQATVDLVWGDKDKVVTLSETELTASLMPNAQVHILKESRHEMDRCDISALAAIVAGQ
jgi:pimeloyl-ACP methyl ester carboxylesterase